MRRLLLALMIWLPLTAQANNDLWVVELAMFSCAYCASIDEDTRRIEDMVDGRFVFAPIPETDDDPLAQVYFMARDSHDARLIRQHLFRMVHKMRHRPSTVTETIEFLAMAGMHVNERAMADVYRSGAVERSFQKTYDLIGHLSHKAVPAFIFIRSGQVIDAITKGKESSAEFMERAIARTKHHQGAAS